MHPKNLWKIILFLASCSASADELDTRVSALESRMTAIKNDTVQNTTGARMASASPLFDGLGFFATVDLLVWHLQEGGSDYCLSSKDLPSTSGEAKHSHFDWAPGFRTGVGYNLEHDAWDWYVNFTWFHTHASDAAHRPENGGLSPQKGFELLDDAESIRSHWHVHYYVLDLEFGRRYFVSKFLSFRPQFGIESAWICQRRRYHVEGNLFMPVENIYGKNNFWGIGPRAGCEGTWYFGRHFSLVGAVAGALQWGQFDDHLGESQGKVKIVDVDGDFHRLVPNVQMALGFSWDSNIKNDEYHLGIRLSYEFQYWWRQNQFLNEQQFNATNFQHESMDLSINGAVLDVRLDF